MCFDMTVLSPISIDPLSGEANPAMSLRRVVLPHPLGPSSATICPFWMFSDTSDMAVTSLYVLVKAVQLRARQLCAIPLLGAGIALLCCGCLAAI